jgi:transcriptional antiterminator RfaH
MNHPAKPHLDPLAWHCVRTQTRREHIAASQLERLDGIDVFCPRIRFQRRTPRGRVWFEEALFPGYLFARFDVLKMGRAVAGTIGVRGLVRFGGECADVPAAVIDFLKSEADGTVVIHGPELKTGDEAVLAEGAMRGLRAVVTQVMPGGERVRILMELMGTAVEAEVPRDALEKVA